MLVIGQLLWSLELMYVSRYAKGKSLRVTRTSQLMGAIGSSVEINRS
jgi:hypothetical protein